jgi:hypothetical protein
MRVAVAVAMRVVMVEEEMKRLMHYIYIAII